MSGIGHAGLLRACWYRRTVTAPTLAHGARLLLHFGAVDYRASVWIDSVPCGSHEGGYTPFTIGVTARLRGGPLTIVVRAEDDPSDLAKPRGKQDWQLEPHSIWYVRTTGIWQTVWLEVVPAVAIGALRWSSNLERWELGLEVSIDGELTPGL